MGLCIIRTQCQLPFDQLVCGFNSCLISICCLLPRFIAFGGLVHFGSLVTVVFLFALLILGLDLLVLAFHLIQKAFLFIPIHLLQPVLLRLV